MGHPTTDDAVPRMRLVVGERRGRSVVCSLQNDHVAALLDQAGHHVEHLRLGLTDER